MDILMILGILYAVLIGLDLIPLIKKKEKKALLLSVPVYLLTMTVMVMIGFGFQFPPLNNMITQIIKSIFPM